METMDQEMSAILSRIKENIQVREDPSKISSPMNNTKKNNKKCKLCNDTGIISSGENGRLTHAKPCKCYTIAKYERMIENSEIGPSFKNIGFRDFITKGKHHTVVKAKNEAMRYFKEFPKIKDQKNNSIAFTSIIQGNESTGIGAGKTHLSIALANNIMDKYKIGVVYLPYRDVVTKLKQNAIDKIYYQREIDKYKLAPVLLIDDLFKGKITESDINILFEIINYRYLNNMPLIVSTEYSPDILREIDDGVASRILHMCDTKGDRHNYCLEIGLSADEYQSGICINHRLT